MVQIRDQILVLYIQCSYFRYLYASIGTIICVQYYLKSCVFIEGFGWLNFFARPLH